MANKAPKTVVRGMRINADASSSSMPVPIRPQGSIPKVENMKTDSGAAVNLKNRVCSIMIAAMPRKSQEKMVLEEVIQLLLTKDGDLGISLQHHTLISKTYLFLMLAKPNLVLPKLVSEGNYS